MSLKLKFALFCAIVMLVGCDVQYVPPNPEKMMDLTEKRLSKYDGRTILVATIDDCNVYLIGVQEDKLVICKSSHPAILP